MSDPTYRLLLELAGRVDDDLLATGRELVTVDEEGHALELLVAELVAGRVVLPSAVRRELVAEAGTRRIQPDADRFLPRGGPGADTPHRFTGDGPTDEIARALAGVTAPDDGWMLAWRVTPAGSAPGPLPHPVLLGRTHGDGSAEVLTYRAQSALAGAGIAASVEVRGDGDPDTPYHRAARGTAVPVHAGPGPVPDGPAPVVAGGSGAATVATAEPVAEAVAEPVAGSEAESEAGPAIASASEDVADRPGPVAPPTPSLPPVPSMTDGLVRRRPGRSVEDAEDGPFATPAAVPADDRSDDDVADDPADDLADDLAGRHAAEFTDDLADADHDASSGYGGPGPRRSTGGFPRGRADTPALPVDDAAPGGRTGPAGRIDTTGDLPSGTGTPPGAGTFDTGPTPPPPEEHRPVTSPLPEPAAADEPLHPAPRPSPPIRALREATSGDWFDADDHQEPAAPSGADHGTEPGNTTADPPAHRTAPDDVPDDGTPTPVSGSPATGPVTATTTDDRDDVPPQPESSGHRDGSRVNGAPVALPARPAGPGPDGTGDRSDAGPSGGTVAPDGATPDVPADAGRTARPAPAPAPAPVPPVPPAPLPQSPAAPPPPAQPEPALRTGVPQAPAPHPPAPQEPVAQEPVAQEPVAAPAPPIGRAAPGPAPSNGAVAPLRPRSNGRPANVPAADEDAWMRDWASGAWVGETAPADAGSDPRPAPAAEGAEIDAPTPPPGTPIVQAPAVPPSTGGTDGSHRPRHLLLTEDTDGPTGGAPADDDPRPSPQPRPAPEPAAAGALAERLSPTEQDLLQRLHEELAARESGGEPTPRNGTARTDRN
ncbi:DNA polymerase III subunits gamma and tau [Pseudonocardia sp. Ae168_Ps1]|uniref:hypothetical protein n=1 Tax=unclassified Pseudonocardia TaxID=2619320 RepID=UPI00094B5CD4|nr:MULTISPECIES: hypothetical protein [unclassified Pseudonocardia]OLL74845.1 DNA polymerase III subunits gamma and tau [Pseudonocardia sp. Ae150A_Ps1]OLL80837.1 DNA polymerase III subunits gamma and tau [Pseudonocardia sp. Ae168_Ps1]OLL85045.1 DNA polymerase III subunits gamma and tau [Pseudonocardia sp. Ae263_Ps1]OLL94938.1 DNA polymerase III subunits gamma and tau [Pseudonocardia sp. Ae356_Ps1]